ncbi:MAG: hypothetical protein RIS29_985, partial [Bacteroidota bacterium]
MNFNFTVFNKGRVGISILFLCDTKIGIATMPHN